MLKKNALVVSTVAALSLMGCAHQSVVPPSQGHIDGSSTQSSPAINKADIPKPVKSNVYLPPPKPRAKEPTYSVVVNEVPVKEILFALARESKLNIDIDPSIKGSVTMNAVDQTLPAILERISSQVELNYKIENNVLSIRPDIPYVKSYPINYVNMERITTGGISVTNQIAGGTLGSVGTTGSGGVTSASSSSSGTSGNTQNQNNSSTSVKSISENKFWTTLIDNVKELLLETDKEELVKRFTTDEKLRDSYGSATSAATRGSGSVVSPAAGNSDASLLPNAASGAGNQQVNANTLEETEKLREQVSGEYRKLYAASVIPNKELGILSVRATSKQHRKVQEFLDKVEASAKRQVLIEASIVEVELNDRYQAGVDWSRLGNGFTFQQQLTSPTTNLAAAPRFVLGYATNSTLGNLAGSISLLQTFGTTKVLSSPKLMVLNSQTAVLKSVDNLVYFNVQATGAVASGNTILPGTTTTTPQTVPVGVWMSVTPQINETGIVTLNVRPTISRKIDEVSDPNPSLINTPNKIPIITVRELESVLQVPSGSTVVLGGLMEDTIDNRSNAVPEVSKLPIFGNLFKAKNDFSRKKELVIFIKPTVISNASLESDELKGYKQFLPAQQLNQMIEGNDY